MKNLNAIIPLKFLETGMRRAKADQAIEQQHIHLAVGSNCAMYDDGIIPARAYSS